MLTYPEINPIALQLGPIAIHWYGLAYAAGFLCFFYLLKFRAKNHSFWNPVKINDLLFYAILGVIIGGRLGFVLFYDFPGFLNNPISLFFIWQGGMSFHGGLIGVLFAIYFFTKKEKQSYFAVTDFIVPAIAPGLFFGRLANFVNNELWGKPTDVAWAMVVPNSAYANIPRHPSQLYEAFLEGLVLFVIIWLFSSKNRPVKAVSGLFILLYGIFRFLVEFIRMPDIQLGYLLGTNWITMGQILSTPMIIFGIYLVAKAYQKPA